MDMKRSQADQELAVIYEDLYINLEDWTRPDLKA